MLRVGKSTCVEIDSQNPSDLNNHELVFCTGEAVTEQTVADEDFNIWPGNTTTELERVVEVY